jgi:hypothetical protein
VVGWIEFHYLRGSFGDLEIPLLLRPSQFGSVLVDILAQVACVLEAPNRRCSHGSEKPQRVATEFTLCDGCTV